MTLLGRHERDDRRPGSYLDLAEVLIRSGAKTTQDLQQLWRRIVFSICVSNTDDHLRNHGFLLTDTGWRLAPAYDLNPVPYGNGLSFNISERDNTLDLELANDVAELFRVRDPKAVITEVVDAVSSWRTTAEDAGLDRTEQDRMAPAFRHATT